MASTPSPKDATLSKDKTRESPPAAQGATAGTTATAEAAIEIDHVRIPFLTHVPVGDDPLVNATVV